MKEFRIFLLAFLFLALAPFPSFSSNDIEEELEVIEISKFKLPKIIVPNEGHSTIKILPDGSLGSGSNASLVNHDYSSAKYLLKLEEDQDYEFNITNLKLPAGLEIKRFYFKINGELIKDRMPFRRKVKANKKGVPLEIGVEIKVFSKYPRGAQNFSYDLTID